MSATGVEEAIAARDVAALVAALRTDLLANSANIPRELKDRKAWLCWRAPAIDAVTGKVRKVPVYPVSRRNRIGEQGGADDVASLGTWSEAGAAFLADETLAGVGLAMLPGFGTVALDVDHCVTDGEIRSDAAKLSDETYCEISPSGTGIRAFWLGTSADGKNHETGFELFHTKAFVTVTGNQVTNTYKMTEDGKLPSLPAGIRADLESRCRAAGKSNLPSTAPDDLTRLVTLQSATADTVQELKSALAGMSKKRADDRGDWINVIHALASLKGTDFESDAYELACEFSARSDKFDPEDLGCKWAGVSPTSITYKSIFSMAQADGWTNPRTVATVVQVATAESVAAAPITARRFARVSMATFIDRKPPAWRIKGLLPNDGVALIYGASGSGKSFFCIDVAMTIARGETWRDFATKQGAVTYVCAEGASDFAKRLAAYAAHRGDGPFDVIDAAPNLLIKVDVEALIAELMLAPVAVVFLDTLACLSVGGDENSAKDMGILLDHCKLIGRMTGALVVLVHHTGKSGDGPRGSSALIAAVDTSIEISRAGDDRVAKVVKLKGGKDGQEFGFKLITVAAGVNEDGDEESSCVVEQTATVPKSQRVQEPKGTNQKIVMRILQQAFELTGEGLFVNVLAEAAARELLHDPSAKRDTRKQKCMDAIEGLLCANRLVKENNLLIPA